MGLRFGGFFGYVEKYGFYFVGKGNWIFFIDKF